LKKVLILGGTGFIGSELAIQMSNDNYEVHILTQGLSHKNINYNEKIKIFSIIYNQKNFSKVLNTNLYSSIFILNGNPHPSYSYNDPLVDVNLLIIPLISLLESLRKINFDGNIWFSSSVAVYGSIYGKLSENLVPDPISPYGISKLNAEKYCKYYFEEYKLNIGILRLFSTYGPNLKRQVVYDTYSKLIKNPDELILLSKKEDSRDMSFVEDLARAIYYLDIKIIPKGCIYNIGSGKEYLILDIVKFVANSLNYKGKITCTSNSQSFDGTSWYADIDKLKSIGFEYNYELQEGLKKTIEYWKINKS
jgi:UDP-glucose 4-epimerase